MGRWELGCSDYVWSERSHQELLLMAFPEVLEHPSFLAALYSHLALKQELIYLPLFILIFIHSFFHSFFLSTFIRLDTNLAVQVFLYFLSVQGNQGVLEQLGLEVPWGLEVLYEKRCFNNKIFSTDPLLMNEPDTNNCSKQM